MRAPTRHHRTPAALLRESSRVTLAGVSSWNDDRERTTTNQLRVMQQSKIQMKWIELAGIVVLVLLYLLARWVEKAIGIDVQFVVMILVYAHGRLTGKPVDRVVVESLRDMPPPKAAELYQRATGRPAPRRPPRLPNEPKRRDSIS